MTSADPIIQAEILQQQIGGKRTHHVLRAVGEIDDVEHAENDGKAEAQQRVERAVDQTDQQLAEQRLRRNAENLEHACTLGALVLNAAPAADAALRRNGERLRSVGPFTSQR